MRSSATFTVVITTSVARWAEAQRTAFVFLKLHPRCRILFGVVDDRYHEIRRTARSDTNFMNVVEAVELAFDESEYTKLVALYSVSELADLIRPILVRAVLRRNPDVPVVSLPDDAETVSALQEFVDQATCGIALSVNRRTPIPRDGRLPDDTDMFAYGLVDHELFAVSAPGLVVLDSWIEQARRHPLIEGDRKQTHTILWLDGAIRLFPNLVSECHGITRSYRNADESLPGSAPLIRFMGFNPNRPWMLSSLAGPWPRVTISAHSDLQSAAHQRSAALLDHLDGPTPITNLQPYSHVAAGYSYDPVMRHLYAMALHYTDRHGLPAPANPFSDGNAFLSWLQEVMASGLTRYLEGTLAHHDDLRASFGNDIGALIAWARVSGPSRGVSPRLAGLLPSPHTTVTPSTSSFATPFTGTGREPLSVSSGVNLVGLFKAEMGVGEAARLAERAVAHSKIPYSLVLDDGTAHRQDDPFEFSASLGFRHDTNVVVANADAIGSVIARLDQPLGSHASVFQSYPTIGLWFWETATFPDAQHAAFRLVDEVWVASRHVYDAIAPAAAFHGVSVSIVPLGARVLARTLTDADVSDIAVRHGVPSGRFCFLFSFDHQSVAERKNPWGLVEAFCRAFPRMTPNGPVLVIKSISGDGDLLGRERLRYIASKRSDIVLIEGFVDVATRQALLLRSNAYVSLHRAEGWGLTMAEAMGLGVPCIATGYSGNLEFMTHANSWLVDYSLVGVAEDVPHYGGHGCWAEPNLEHAASLMQQVVDNADERERRANAAAIDIRAMATSDAGGRFVLDRLRAARRLDLNHRRSGTRAEIRLGDVRQSDWIES